MPDGKMVRVALFIDGGFFAEVGKYYAYHSEKPSNISIVGLQRFLEQKVAECEKADPTYCRVVESHYFRGRLSAEAAMKGGSQKLENDRKFDMVLMKAGVVQHYLPLNEAGDRPKEKGIDVWLSLEAYDLAVHKRFDVFALVSGDGDYVPLVRKLNALGTRVMLLAWDLDATNTRVSSDLLDAANYKVMMNREIEDRARKRDPIVRDLLIPKKERAEEVRS